MSSIIFCRFLRKKVQGWYVLAEMVGQWQTYICYIYIFSCFNKYNLLDIFLNVWVLNLNQIHCSVVYFLFSSTGDTKHSRGSKLDLIETYIFACLSRWNIEQGTILYMNKFQVVGIGILKFSVILFCFLIPSYRFSRSDR